MRNREKMHRHFQVESISLFQVYGYNFINSTWNSTIFIFFASSLSLSMNCIIIFNQALELSFQIQWNCNSFWYALQCYKYWFQQWMTIEFANIFFFASKNNFHELIKVEIFSTIFSNYHPNIWVDDGNLSFRVSKSLHSCFIIISIHSLQTQNQSLVLSLFEFINFCQIYFLFKFTHKFSKFSLARCWQFDKFIFHWNV